MMIVVFISYSGWSHHVIQKKSVALQTSLVHLLQFARHEAIVQNKIIHVAYSSDQHQIMVSIQDPVVIQRILILPTHYVLHSNQSLGFYFNPEGRCLTPGTMILIPEQSPQYQRKIIINDSGRARIASG